MDIFNNFFKKNETSVAEVLPPPLSIEEIRKLRKNESFKIYPFECNRLFAMRNMKKDTNYLESIGLQITVRNNILDADLKNWLEYKYVGCRTLQNYIFEEGIKKSLK